METQKNVTEVTTNETTPVTKKKTTKTDVVKKTVSKNPIKVTKKRYNLTIGTIFGFILGIIIASGISVLIYKQLEKHSKHGEHEMMMRLAYYITLEREQEYWDVKGEITRDIDLFIRKNAPFSNLSSHVLLLETDKGNIDVRLPMAQGLIEGHYGTKGLSALTNNLCNVGAYDGLPYEQIAEEFKKPHINESIEPYVTLIKKRYLSDGRNEWDLLKNFVDVNGKRYATNPLYESELKEVIDRINSETRLDSLLQKYNYLRRELNR
jgi:flagellum-specific peptidoglycan hydrolase FlgJ